MSTTLICVLIINHYLKLFLATSKQRTKFIKIITAGKKKASVLIEKINNLHREQFPENKEKTYLNFDDFSQGSFPWQLPDDKGTEISVSVLVK